jgi:hypothetical protein
MLISLNITHSTTAVCNLSKFHELCCCKLQYEEDVIYPLMVTEIAEAQEDDPHHTKLTQDGS